MVQFGIFRLDAGSLYVVRRHGGLKHLYGDAPVAVASAKTYFLHNLEAMVSRLESGSSYLVRRPVKRRRCAPDDLSRLGSLERDLALRSGLTLSPSGRATPCLSGGARAELRTVRRVACEVERNVRALDSVRVLDFTTMVAGPVATMMLADQGADVIKVESPRGDLMRHFSRRRNGMSALFMSCNRNKRSLEVDLKTVVGLEIIKKLIPTAVVLVHNFRPGTAERIGLGEDAVRALRRDIVYVSISGFGETGPYAGQRAYDPVIQAMSGLADVQRDHDTGRPRMVRTIIADNTTALTAAQAITAALFARARTGQGQHVRIAMLDMMVAYLWPDAMTSLTFVGDEPILPWVAGPDLVFATQDRYLTTAALSDDEWAGMCRALNREDLLDDPRFKSARDRSAIRRTPRAGRGQLEQWTAREILPRLVRMMCRPRRS